MGISAASSEVEGPVPEGTVVDIAADPIVVGAAVSGGEERKCAEGSGITSSSTTALVSSVD